MFEYLKRLVLFLLLYLVFIQLVKFSLPYYAGNVQLIQKMSVIKNSGVEYNSFFIGNSEVNRQINPVTFDRITNGLTTSYNMGADATPFHECYYLIDKLSGDKDFEGVKNFFLVVNKPIGINERNINTFRTSYCLDFKRMRHLLEYWKNDKEMCKNYIKAFLQNSLGMYRLKRLFNYSSIINTTVSFLKNHQGFVPMSRIYEELILPPSPITYEYSSILEMQSEFLGSQAVGRIEGEFTNEELLIYNAIVDMKSILKSRGKELYLVYPPNNYLHFKYKFDNSIYLGDGPEFKAFYDLDNRYNFGHLNEIGAELYTDRIARGYLEVVK